MPWSAGDTSDPDRLSEEVKQILLSFSADSMADAELERVKKKKIGAFLRSLNSPEYIANQFTRYAFNEVSLFDVIPVLQSLTIEQIDQIAKQCFRESQIAVCQVVPKERK